MVDISDSLIPCLTPSSSNVGKSVTTVRLCRKAANALSNHSGRVSEKIKILSPGLMFNESKPRPMASIRAHACR